MHSIADSESYEFFLLNFLVTHQSRDIWSDILFYIRDILTHFLLEMIPARFMNKKCYINIDSKMLFVTKGYKKSNEPVFV